jgi:hypothetical protein
MSIFKRKNGTYSAEIYVNSKRVATKRGFKTKAEAQAFEDQIKFQHLSGNSHIAKEAVVEKPKLCDNKPTFETLLEVYERLHLPKVRWIVRLAAVERIRYMV